MGINWNGHPPIPLTHIKLRRRVKYALKNVHGLYVTATTDGQHAPTSWHYSGHAVDFGSDDSQNRPEKRAQQILHRKFGNRFRELFGPKPFYVKDGRVYGGVFPGHSDHTHVAA